MATGVAILAISLGIASCAACYSPKYVYRVFRYGGADYSDIHKFKASTIAPAASPSALPAAPDPGIIEVLESYPDIERVDDFLRQTETTAFLVVHGGQLVLERYLRGNTAESAQNTFSVSKSIMSAVVGLAVRDGALDLQAPITAYLPELAERDARFASIRVADLLNMESGIKYSHKVSFPFINADDALIYYHPDLESVVLERTKIASAPGEFQYNNYNPPLIGLILRRTTGLSVSAYLERELWKPMGAEAAAGWTVDDKGMERMESGFHARARDLARFGLMYLRSGELEGASVVPATWVQNTTRLLEDVDLENYNGRAWSYNSGWWIVPRPEEPSDFCAIGAKGQFIYVSPQYDCVFVRNGPGRGDWGDFDWTALFYYVAERL